MLQGLRTVIYPTSELATAIAWYTKVVSHAPYFNEPFYAKTPTSRSLVVTKRDVSPLERRRG